MQILLSAFQQPVYIHEPAAQDFDIKTVGIRHLVGQTDEDLPEQRSRLLDIGVGAQFAMLDPSPDDIALQPVFLLHPFMKLALAVRVVEQHLLVKVKIPGIGRLSRHIFALEISQTHNLAHRAAYAHDILVDEVGH